MYRLEAQALEALNRGEFCTARDVQNELLALAGEQLTQDDWRFKGSRLRADTFAAIAELPEHRKQSVMRALILFKSGNQNLVLERFDESSEEFEQAAELIKANLGTKNFLYSEALETQGKALLQSRHLSRARKAFQQAAEAKKSFFGDDHPAYAFTILALGRVDMDLGDFESAEKHILRALEIRERDFGDDFVDTIMTYQDAAVLYLKKSDAQAAEKYATRAADLATKCVSKGHSVRVVCLWRLAQCCAARSDFVKATSIYEEIVPEFERTTCNVNAPVAAEIIEDYAAVLSQLNKEAAAKQMRAWGQKVREDGVGTSKPRARKVSE